MCVWGDALTSYKGPILINVHERIVRNLFMKFNPGECPFKATELAVPNKDKKKSFCS